MGDFYGEFHGEFLGKILDELLVFSIGEIVVFFLWKNAYFVSVIIDMKYDMFSTNDSQQIHPW